MHLMLCNDHDSFSRTLILKHNPRKTSKTSINFKHQKTPLGCTRHSRYPPAAARDWFGGYRRLNQVHLPECHRRIIVATAGNVYSDDVADLAVGLMFRGRFRRAIVVAVFTPESYKDLSKLVGENLEAFFSNKPLLSEYVDE
ncbi:unnamed protein product [Dovyalis caffra]|uniref:Uncharacterized protein n=1 Tax=Dovyalis caffra TaxID=77055 RepID=A0AAV1S920_9ROSI|nr:unnamed protein product [Dovyalis caffra]